MTKKQIVIIHGGRTFNKYEDYINSLKNREVNIDKFKYQPDWRSSFQEKIGEDYEVFFPKMPNGNNAVYVEWKIWFERMAEFFSDNIILIGQSLGGIFLVKYLSENESKVKIKSLILVACPCDTKNMEEDLEEFVVTSPYKNVSDQVGGIYLMFSEDDPVVPIVHLQKYKNFFPDAEEIIFNDKGHFNQEQFPELIELVKKI